MYFLGLFCFLLSAAATPITSKFLENQPSDGNKISYVVLEPADLSQLGNFPWNPDFTDKSEDYGIFLIKGISNKKFGHLNAFKQLQNIRGNKVSIADHAGSNKLDETNKNVNGISFYDRPCNRYDANEMTAKINAVQPVVNIKSSSEYTSKEESKQEQPAFTNNEELKTVDIVKNKIPAPPTIDTSSKTNQQILLSDKSGYKYQPEIYNVIQSKSVLNGQNQVSSDVTVKPASSIKSSNNDEQWVSKHNIEKIEMEQDINEPSISNQPKTNVNEKTVTESDSSEEDTKPIVKLNIPAPPSIEGTITLPSGYASLSALQNEEKILMEKIKHLKLHSTQIQPERVEEKSKFEYNQDVHKEDVIKKPSALVSASEKTHVTQEIPPSIDVSVVHNSAQWSKDEERPDKTSEEVSNESNMESYTKPESIKKLPEISTTTERQVEPLVKLNIPAPPSIDNTITLPSGYSSLSDLQNEERIILQKLNPVRLHKQDVSGEVVDKSSYQYHPETYKLAKINFNPLFNAEGFKNVATAKETNPTVTIKTPGAQSLDALVGHESGQWVAEKGISEKTSEFNGHDGTSTEDIKPAVILNIPPPPSIDNSITLPSGYSSLEAIQNEEKNILRRIANLRIKTHRQPVKVVDSSSFENNPEQYKVEVVKTTPDVNVDEKKSIVTVDTPAPPSIDSSYLNKQQNEEENKANSEIKSIYVVHDNSEESNAKTNMEEVNTNEQLSNQERFKPVIPLHIPPPPSIDGAIVLPSKYPTLSEIRNEEIILTQKVNGKKNHAQKPVKGVDSTPQINRVDVVVKQPEANVQETSHTVKYNIPVPPSLGGSVVLPSGYLTHSKIQDIERWIMQKIKEQREKQAAKDSDQKVVVPDRNVWVKPAIKTNIPPPPSISGASQYSEYAKQQKVVKLPQVHISGPIIRWNTPAPPTVNKGV